METLEVKSVIDLLMTMSAKLDGIHDDISALGERVASVEAKVEAIPQHDSRLRELEHLGANILRIDKVEAKVDAIGGRVGDLEESRTRSKLLWLITGTVASAALSGAVTYWVHTH